MPRRLNGTTNFARENDSKCKKKLERSIRAVCRFARFIEDIKKFASLFSVLRLNVPSK